MIINGVSSQYFFQKVSLKTAKVKAENKSQEKTFGEIVKNEANEETPIIKSVILSFFDLDTEMSTADKNNVENNTDIPGRPTIG